MELTTHQNNHSNDVYETIDYQKLATLEQDHEWLTKPLYAASDALLKMPFFEWLNNIESPEAFKESAKQLYYHSATFPKVLGIMLGFSTHQENTMMPYYAKHIYGEADHHQLLANWLLKNHLVNDHKEIEETIVTLETNACINLAYRLAAEQDREKWIVAINCGIERCSNDFFKQLAPKMRKLGVGDCYFDIHVEADEHHSVMGLEYIQSYANDSQRGQQLVAIALEAVALWGAMLHSWIKIDVHPRFDLTGKLVSM